MANAILRGSSQPQQQWWEISYSPSQGSMFHTEYRGINLNNMGGLAQSLFHAGYSGNIRFERNVATLTASIPASATNVAGFNSPALDIVDKWEVGVDQEKPELFENTNFLTLFAAVDASYGLPISQQVAAAIRAAANNSTTGWSNLVSNLKATIGVDATGTAISGSPTLWSIITAFSIGQGVKYFADDYFRGRTNFIHGKYILRHITYCPNTYSGNVADFNVENIYSIAQLLSEAGNGALWILPLPGYLAYKILTYPVPATAPPNFAFGALKLRSGAVTSARERIEISTEYLIDTWPQHTYRHI